MSVTETVTIESRERGAYKSTLPGGNVPGPRTQRPPISPAEQTRAKLDARLLEVIRRAARNERVEAAFVRAGRAEVQVFLTEKTEAVRAQLRELGFEMIADPSSKLIIGRIKVEALERLAAFDFVRHIAPLVTGAR
jgi:hypothetical protein